jgi:CRP-like cAMP-binding protein
MRELLDFCRERLPERTFPAGEVVLEEGRRAGVLYILAEGSVEVVKGTLRVNAVSDAGAVFGEISVLLDTPHTATVKTLAPSRFYVVDEPLAFIRSTPDVAAEVARLLAKRLYAMTSYLADVKRQFEEHGDHLTMVDEILAALAHDQGEDQAPGSDRDPDPTVE